MNCKFTNAIMFAAGAAIGSAVTWKVLKTQFEQRIQEEVESVKEALSGLNNVCDQSSDDSEDEEEEEASEAGYHQVNWDELEDLDEENEEDEELEEYAELTNLYSNEKGGAEKVIVKKPYVISPYDFGEIDEYHKIDLTYYADGILEDEDGEIVTDVDELIGVGSLNTFGEYEDDAVFVRNERLQTDFEILKDYRTYEEATGNSPKQVRN